MSLLSIILHVLVQTGLRHPFTFSTVNSSAVGAGISMSLSFQTTGVPPARVAVTATPHLYTDNFTSTVLDASWMIDCGASCPTLTVSSQARPGYVRFNSELTDTAVYVSTSSR